MREGEGGRERGRERERGIEMEDRERWREIEYGEFKSESKSGL